MYSIYHKLIMLCKKFELLKRLLLFFINHYVVLLIIILINEYCRMR